MMTFSFPWLPDITPRTERTATAEAYAGDRVVEERVVAEVASYGKQLGILAEAVLEIADERQGAGVERLRSLVNRIETIKARHNRSLEERAEEAFGALIAADPAAADRLLTAMERRLAGPVVRVEDGEEA